VYGAVLGIAQEVAIANFSCLKLRRKCHDWCAGTQVLVLVAPGAHDSREFVKSFYSAGTLAGYFLTNRGAHVKQVVYKPNKTPPETPKATIQSFLRETCAVKRVIVYIGHGSKDGSIHLAGTPVAPAELSQWIEESGGASRTGLALAMCYGGSCSRLLDREMGFVFTGSLPHQQEFGQELPNWFFDDGKVLPLANSNAVCSGKIVQGHPAAVNGEVIMCKTCRGGGSSGGSRGGAGGRRGGAGGGATARGARAPMTKSTITRATPSSTLDKEGASPTARQTRQTWQTWPTESAITRVTPSSTPDKEVLLREIRPTTNRTAPPHH
jgi:hypothetical protein